MKRWTIRECASCGCVHDFPDAGCPQCGSKMHWAFEVIPAGSPNVLQDKVEARKVVSAIRASSLSRDAQLQEIAQRLRAFVAGDEGEEGQQ